MKKLLLYFVLLFAVIGFGRSYGQVGPINGPSDVCVGHTVSFTDTTPGGIWSSGNTAVATVDAYGHVTGIAGPYTINIFYTVSSIYTVNKEITVMPAAGVMITAIPGDTLCAGTLDTFFATIAGDSVMDLEWYRDGRYFRWGDTLIYVPSSGDSINLTYSDVCLGDTSIRTSNSIIKIVDNPPNAGVITGPDTFCISAYNNYITLTDTVAGGNWFRSNDYAAFYYSSPGEVTGVYPGTDIFYYVVSNVCGTDTAMHSLTVSSCGFEWSIYNCLTFDPVDTLSWQELITIDTFHYRHNQWQVGSPQKIGFDSAYSYPDAIVTDTINPYAPLDTSVFIVTFPGASRPSLYYYYAIGYIYSVSFEYELDIDSNSFAEIDLSTDSGKTWINMQDSIPDGLVYPSLPLYESTGWHSFNIEGFSYAAGGWGYQYINSDSLMIKFTFVSGTNPLGKNGWMIDDLCLVYQVPGKIHIIKNTNLITVFPNPANDELTLWSTQQITNITITNLLGQTIITNNYNTDTVQIDVSALPAGVYFVRINGTEVRKFVKE